MTQVADFAMDSNDDANGTAYEHDIISNQFRNGGDVQGLVDSLDYLQGMGIKVRLQKPADFGYLSIADFAQGTILGR
jgi:glycosidase